MFTNEQVLEAYEKVGALLKGHFVLSSGMHSDQYMQSALVCADPQMLAELIRCLISREAMMIKGITKVVSPAVGGIQVGYEVARQLGCDAIFAEREDGKLIFRRGYSVSSEDTVLLMEDVVTTGKTTKELAELVLAGGAPIIGVSALIHRKSKNAPADPTGGLEFSPLVAVDVDAWPAEDCSMCKDDVPVTKLGSRPTA